MKKISVSNPWLSAGTFLLLAFSAFTASAGSIAVLSPGSGIEGNPVSFGFQYTGACGGSDCGRTGQNITIYWGDGGATGLGGDTNYSASYVYAAPGTYSISVSGYTACGGFYCCLGGCPHDNAGGSGSIIISPAALCETRQTFVARG